MMGTEAWREAMYGQPAQFSLLDAHQDNIRTANVPQMLDWVKARLESLFPGVTAPKVLYQTTRSGKQGAPLFALFFAVSNPSKAAVGLALRIAGSVLR